MQLPWSFTQHVVQVQEPAHVIAWASGQLERWQNGPSLEHVPCCRHIRTPRADPGAEAASFEVCQELRQHASDGPSFTPSAFTGGKTWVHCCDLSCSRGEKRAEILEWKRRLVEGTARTNFL